MNGPRYLYPVLGLFLVLLLAWWIRERSPMAQRQQAAAGATATVVVPTAPTTSAITPRPPLGHRLAGLAVGAVSFVAVEHPDGSTALYRIGDDVPGLGRVEAITEAGATFNSDNGTMTLQVTAPAPPTPTAVQARAAATGPPSALTPTPPLPPGRTAPESPPSVAPDQSAS